MIDKKKKAAVAAVMHYLACENIQPSEEAQGEMELHQAAAPSPGVQPWALSGRQAQMQMRTMVQMKAFH
ncbi:MAG: hypothetical protein ACOC7W_02380 [Desulfosalsimonas sp.]